MHPLELYHHQLCHSGFGEECAVCPHEHPETDKKVFVLAVGLIALSAITLSHLASKKGKYYG